MKRIPLLLLLLLSVSGWVACDSKSQSASSAVENTVSTAEASDTRPDSVRIALDPTQVRTLCEALKVNVVAQQQHQWKISKQLANDLKVLDKQCAAFEQHVKQQATELENIAKLEGAQRDSLQNELERKNVKLSNSLRLAFDKVKAHLPAQQSTEATASPTSPAEEGISGFTILIVLLVLVVLGALIWVGARQMKAEGKLTNGRPMANNNTHNMQTSDLAKQVEQLQNTLNQLNDRLSQQQKDIQVLKDDCKQLELRLQQLEMKTVTSVQQPTPQAQQLLYFAQPTFAGADIVFRGGHPQPTAQDCWIIDTQTGEVTLNPSSFSFSLPRAKEFLGVFADILNLNQVPSPTRVDYVAKGLAQDLGNGIWKLTRKMQIRLL